MRPSLLAWLCTSLSAGLPLWSFSCSLTTLVLQARLAAYLCCVELFNLSLSSSFLGSRWCNFLPGDCAAVCSRSASLHPATELRSARGRASVCSGPCCESSSGSSALLMARVESRQFSAQPFLKLRHVQVSRMSSFHLGHFLCRTREANSLAFLTEATRSLCN